jgi:hypothetical protein
MPLNEKRTLALDSRSLLLVGCTKKRGSRETSDATKPAQIVRICPNVSCPGYGYGYGYGYGVLRTTHGTTATFRCGSSAFRRRLR